MARNRNRKATNNGNADTRRSTRRRILLSLVAGIVFIGVAAIAVFAYNGDLHLPGRGHDKNTTVTGTTPPDNVAKNEDNSAPPCTNVVASIFGDKTEIQNAADQPILNDNSRRLAPQYACVVVKNGSTYIVGTSKEKPLPKKKAHQKTQPDPLLDYIVTEYTYDPATKVGDPKLSAHDYKAVSGYDNTITAPVRQVVTSAKVFVYNENQIRGGVFKCGDVIVSLSVDGNIGIDKMNGMIDAALKNPVLKKECGK